MYDCFNLNFCSNEIFFICLFIHFLNNIYIKQIETSVPLNCITPTKNPQQLYTLVVKIERVRGEETFADTMGHITLKSSTSLVRDRR